MTINLALEYIPRRMAELGIGDKYYLRFRHFVLQGAEVLMVDSFNQFYILVEEVSDISVASELGVFDLRLINTNEMLYEHQGQVVITNYLSSINHVRFIQVIPMHIQKEN